MQTHSYTTISGEVIEYEAPNSLEAAFLARVTDAVHDPNVGEAELTELIYGKENPILDQTVLPHHGVVTKLVFANPLYHVMTDLLARKRVAAGTLDVARAADRFTMTVNEAAEKLDVHPSAIRQAIAGKKLAAQKKGGTHYIDPRSVDAYRVSRRGPKPRPTLDVTLASDSTGSMRIKPEIEVTRRFSIGETRCTEGVIDGYERAAIIYGPKGSYRTVVVEPAGEDSQVVFGHAMVHGRFRVVHTYNNSARASEVFKSFDPYDWHPPWYRFDAEDGESWIVWAESAEDALAIARDEQSLEGAISEWQPTTGQLRELRSARRHHPNARTFLLADLGN